MPLGRDTAEPFWGSAACQFALACLGDGFSPRDARRLASLRQASPSQQLSTTVEPALKQPQEKQGRI